MTPRVFVRKTRSLIRLIRNCILPPPVPNLAGDRKMEWDFCATRIGRYADERSSVLDFGCGRGDLAQAAASLCARVLAIDLTPQKFVPRYPNVKFRQADVMMLNEAEERFDLILNCSVIEHVGLVERCGSPEDPDGDLKRMEKLRRLLKPDGHMVLTVPVGRDAVLAPLHRVYGQERLPALLEGYDVLEARFWAKDHRNVWLSCSMEKAFKEVGTPYYYALGLMVLRPKHEEKEA